MLLTKEQAEEWQTEAIKYLEENDCNWVTVDIPESEGDKIYIYPNRLPGDETEEEESYIEMMGSEVLSFKNKAQFVLCHE